MTSVADDFQHVVLTRFNLATPGRESAIRNRPGWLAERFDLFERYCLPTMAAQTDQDFSWIIFFDEETPAEFRERIARCRAVREFIPYFTRLFPSDGWAEAVRERVAPQRPWLLSTRLDNDDGLAVDYMARLHAAVRAAPARRTEAYNFTNGFLLGGARLYRHAHPKNAFFSRLEPWDASARTASSIPHMDLPAHGPVVQLDGPGAWLQVVHGGNVSNKIRGERVDPAEAAGRFPRSCVQMLAPATLAERVIENRMMGPLRRARDGLVDIIRGRRPSA